MTVLADEQPYPPASPASASKAPNSAPGNSSRSSANSAMTSSVRGMHHFLKVRRSAEVSAEWILHGLVKADTAIRARTSAMQLPQDSVSIALPDLRGTSLPYAEAYSEAAARLKAATPAGWLTLTWLGRHTATMTLHDAHVEEGASRDADAKLTVETARAFNAQADADSATWIALNPQKGEIDRKPGWAEDERLRRLAATSRNEDTTC